MKIKRRTQIATQPKPDSFLICEKFAPISFDEYSRRINKLTKKQIRTFYGVVFPGKPLPESIVWAKYQVQYELARQAEIRKGSYNRLMKGSLFRQAYLGTMRCDLEATSPTLKTLIPLEEKEMKTKIENETAAVKKQPRRAKTIGVTLGLSVYDTWAAVFQKNETEHKTDAQITEFLLQEFPDHQIKSFHQVHTCRGYYNNGRFTKGVKPAVKSVAYNEAGQPISRKAVKAPVEPVKNAPSANMANLNAVKSAKPKPKTVKVKISKPKAKAKSVAKTKTSTK